MRLASLQRWMQAVVVHPGTTDEALRSKAATVHLNAGRLETVLLPSPTLTAAQRIAIYQEMYPLRMRDALSSDYPGLEHFLGDRFWDFVTAYTKAHPSMGYTLNRLGDHVPAFLARQKTLKPQGFLADLARLELAITESFDASHEEPMRAAEFEACPKETLAKSVLQTSPSLRLVSLGWNAGAYLDTLRDDDHRHPKPRRATSLLAVVRRDYSVFRFDLTPPAFAVLSDLQSGHTVGHVVERGMARRQPRRAAAEDFGNWFRDWAAQGVFTGIRRARPSRPRSRT